MSLLGFNDFYIKLNIDNKYKAHLSKDKQSKEALKKHIDLVFDYFLKLIEQNGLEVRLNSLFEKSANLFQDIEADTDGILIKIRKEERLEELDALVETLKPKDKLVIRLRYYNGMSIQEISNQIGMGVSATKMRIKRAKEKLMSQVAAA